MSKSDIMTGLFGDTFLEALIRMSSVKRWHLVETTRDQTLSEHSANVALLSYRIADAMGCNAAMKNTIVAQALMHDMAEAFVGDSPTTTKYHPLVKGLRELEAELHPSKGHAYDDLPTRFIIKLADVADSYRFVSTFGVGTVAKWAADGCEGRMHDAARKLWLARGQMPWAEQRSLTFMELATQDGLRMAYTYAYEARGKIVEETVHRVTRGMDSAAA